MALTGLLLWLFKEFCKREGFLQNGKLHLLTGTPDWSVSPKKFDFYKPWSKIFSHFYFYLVILKDQNFVICKAKNNMNHILIVKTGCHQWLLLQLYKIIISQGKPCWIMNTLRNVRVLENHVGKEVHQYMKEIDSRTHDQVANLHYVESQRWIETQQLPEGTRKVIWPYGGCLDLLLSAVRTSF